MIGTSKTTRVGQDISFPKQSVFPHDPSFDAFYGRGPFHRSAARPYGVPGARVREPELGDIGDAIGGGEENIGPEGPGFPGGATPRATFIPPPPFPQGPPGPSQPSEIDRAIALGRTALGGARQVSRLVDLLTPPDQGTQPTAPGLAEQRAGERQDFTDALNQPEPQPSQTGDGLGDVAGSLQEPAPIGFGGEIPEPGLPSGGELGLDFDLGNLASGGELPSTPGLASGGELGIDFQAPSGGDISGGEVGVDFDAGSTPIAGEGSGIGLGDIASGVVAAANIAQTAMSDRPDVDKAAIASGQAAQAGLSIAGESTAAAGVGIALNAALLGESLASGKTGGEAGDIQGRQTVADAGEPHRRSSHRYLPNATS